MAPEPAQPPGTLMVTSAEKKRAVRVDGVERGVTPLTLKLPPGDHAVEVEGYAPKTVHISSRQRASAVFK